MCSFFLHMDIMMTDLLSPLTEYGQKDMGFEAAQ